MGVQGFPTLKIVKPGSKRPVVEDYQGARSAKAIVDAVVDKIPNHVKKVQDEGLEAWLTETNDTAKAILFTEKGTTSALLRSLAIDFLGGINVAQIRRKETAAINMFGITNFPSLVLLPGGIQESILYNGEMKKEPMVTFLSQVMPPNPDPAPKKAKASSSSKKSKRPVPSASSSSSSQSSTFSDASEAHQSADASDFVGSASTIILDDVPTESPNPIIPPAETPITVPEAFPPIPTLLGPVELTVNCLAPKTGSCILVLLPSIDPQSALPQSAIDVLSGLAEIADKHAKRPAKTFPFYAIPAENEAAKTVRGELGLMAETELEILAVNMKRGWWRRYTGQSHSSLDIEGFIDSIKLGEGSKERLPAGFFAGKVEEPKQDEHEQEQEHDEL